METTFTKELIAKIKLEPSVIVENGGRDIKINFLPKAEKNESQERRLFMVELFNEIFNHKLKVKTFSFSFKNKEGSEFIFNLTGHHSDSAFVTKIGTLSLYLTKDEITKLQEESGQKDNLSHKVVTFAFNPQKLEELNYTIFYLHDLLSCVIENPNPDIL